MRLEDFDKLDVVKADDRGRVTIGSEFANEQVQVCVNRLPDRDELEDDAPEEKKEIVGQMYQWAIQNGISPFDARPHEGVVIDTNGERHDAPYQFEESDSAAETISE